MMVRTLLLATAMSAIPQSSSGAHRDVGTGHAGDPWAIGYAVRVARSCPNWKVEPQETLAARGVLVPPAGGTGLMPLDGPFQRDYYRGQADAETDLRRHEGFCGRIRNVTGVKWPRLARVLTTTGAGTGSVQRRHSRP